MKKIYLSVLSILASGGLFAQTNVNPSQVVVNNTPERVTNQGPTIIQTNPNPFIGPAFRTLPDRRDITYSFIKIGNTKYDLQSNASIGRRIIVHADGTVSAVWTTSTDNAFLNRGTGYNHHNGLNWFPAPTLGATPRIEDSRTGWPSIGMLDGDKEFTFGHDATSGGFILSKNAAIGNQTFASQQMVLNPQNSRPIWGRAASNGTNYIHVIANYADSSAPSEPPAPIVNGVRAPMTYSRSSDGGQTWDIEHITLPGYDSTRWIAGSADNYAIDVRDSVVAIVTGRLGTDVAMWKSTDNGTTFTHYFVDSFPYAPFTGDFVTPDTPFCSDGTFDILIDADGKCHVWYGLARVFNSDPFTEGFSFFPATAGLVYWNEDFDGPRLIANGSMFDRNGNGMLDVEPGTYSSLAAGGALPGIPSVGRLGNTSLIRQPSAGIDAQGRLFVTFSVPIEGDLDFGNVNLRDIYLMHSVDGGETWGSPQNVTQMLERENDFACIAKRVNGIVHMIFQQDRIAGTNLQNNSSSDNNHPIAESGNDIYYAAIPVEEILDSTIGNIWKVNVKEINNPSKVFVVSQNTPNPFTGQTDIAIYLNDYTASLKVEIRDITGKVIFSNNVTNLTAGNHIITVDATNYSSGVYFYTLTSGNNSVTNKMIVH